MIQVRLDAGEQVEVIEARRLGNGPAAQTWYKIVPPAGEFRWISGQYLDRTPPGEQVRKADPNNNLLIANQERKARRQRNRPDPQLASMRSGGAAAAAPPRDRDCCEDPVLRRRS